MTTKAKHRSASHAAAHDAGDAPSSDGGRLIKYLGAAHNRVLDKGEDFGGRLGTPLPKRVEWNLANNHMVKSDDAGLSDAAIELLLEMEGDQFDSGQYEDADEDGYAEASEENTIRVIKEFADVTNDELIQPSLAQQIFLGMSEHQTADDAIRKMEAEVAPPNPAAQAVMSPGGDAVVSGSAESAEVADGAEQSGSPSGANDTTVGGSTDGGDSGGSAPTTTVGGSTSGVGGDQ